MSQATDQQMQHYADERIRVRAEQFRALVNACRNDYQQIGDVFDRAANGAAWNDGRTDGPPHLMTSQDVLRYNTIIVMFLRLIDNAANDSDRIATVTDFSANWSAFQTACVRPIN